MRTLLAWSGLSGCHMYWFPGAAVTKYHKLSGLKQWKCIFSWFWRIQVWNQSVCRAILFWDSTEESDSCLSPSFWWFMAILGILWLVASSLQLLLLSSHHCFPSACVSVSKCPYTDTSHTGFSIHPNPVWPHLNLIISQILFLNKVTFTSSEGEN